MNIGELWHFSWDSLHIVTLLITVAVLAGESPQQRKIILGLAHTHFLWTKTDTSYTTTTTTSPPVELTKADSPWPRTCCSSWLSFLEDSKSSPDWRRKLLSIWQWVYYYIPHAVTHNREHWLHDTLSTELPSSGHLHSLQSRWEGRRAPAWSQWKCTI